MDGYGRLPSARSSVEDGELRALDVDGRAGGLGLLDSRLLLLLPTTKTPALTRSYLTCYICSRRARGDRRVEHGTIAHVTTALDAAQRAVEEELLVLADEQAGWDR
jgi:hypothetical protein